MSDFSGPCLVLRPVLVAGVATIVGLYAQQGVEIDETAEVWWAPNAHAKQAKGFLGKSAHAINLGPDGCVSDNQLAAIFEPLTLKIGAQMFDDRWCAIIALNTGAQRVYWNTAVRKVSNVNMSTQSGGMPFDGITILCLPKSTAAGLSDADAMYSDSPHVTVPGVYDTYTSAFASTVLTSNNTLPTNGKKVNLNGKVYTWRTVLTGADGDVLIKDTADNCLLALAHAINASGGTPGTDYIAYAPHPKIRATATVTAHTIPIKALFPGTPGNALTTTTDEPTLSFTGGTLAGADGVFTGATAKVQSTMRADLMTWVWADNNGTPITGFEGFTGMEGAKISINFEATMKPSNRLGWGGAYFADLTASVTMIPESSASHPAPTPEQVDAALLQQGSGAAIGGALTRSGYTLTGTAPTGGLSIVLNNAGMQSNKRHYEKDKDRQGEVMWITGTDIAAGVRVAPIAISIAA